MRDHQTFVAQARASRWKMSRLRAAGKLVPDGTTVLDLGCGAMLLKEFIPSDCRYIPADLYAERHPDIVPTDLNAGEFPDGQFDIVVLLAVLFAIDDPLALLQVARQRSKGLLITASEELGARVGRDYAVLLAAGWTVTRVATIPLPLRRWFDPLHKLLLCR